MVRSDVFKPAFTAFVLALLGACGSDTAPTTPSVATRADSLAKPANFPPLAGQIAFISTRDGSQYIYVAAADGSSLRRLTKGQNQDWSWDEQQIVFNAFDEDSAGNLSVHVINADGTGERVLPVFGSTPHLSPDGRRISFTTALGLYVANIDGSHSTLIVPNDIQQPGAARYSLSDAGWSPDGTRIALASFGPWSDDGTTPQPAVYVVKSNGSEIELLAQPGEFPRWSPEGSTIAYGLGGGGGIDIANVDGSGTRPLTSSINLDLPFWPDWSPDGRMLSFTGGYASDCVRACIGPLGKRIFAVDQSLNEAIQLVPNATSPASLPYDDFQAVWSRVAKP